MHDEAVQSQCFGAVQFFAERGDRLCAQRFVRRRDVDQVAVMSDDWRDVRVAHAPAEERDLGGG
jgi:hypothetical protein